MQGQELGNVNWQQKEYRGLPIYRNVEIRRRPYYIETIRALAQYFDRNEFDRKVFNLFLRQKRNEARQNPNFDSRCSFVLHVGWVENSYKNGILERRVGIRNGIQIYYYRFKQEALRELELLTML